MLLTLNDAFEEQWDSRTANAIAVLGPACRIICLKRPDKTVIPIGSALLINVQGEPCILTAGHVLDLHSHGAMYIQSERGLICLRGSFHRAHDVHPDGDVYDFGFQRLQVEDVRALGSESFINQFSRNHLKAEDHRFLMLGYPVTKNPANHGARQIKIQLLPFISGAALEGDHFLVTHDPKKVLNRNKERVNPANLHGMSGGGLFDLGRVADLDIFSSSHPGTLCGLIVEEDRAAKHVKCLRIDVIYDAIVSVLEPSAGSQ